MLIGAQLIEKSKEVNIKINSPLASSAFIGQVTKHNCKMACISDLGEILVVSGPCGWSTHKRKTHLRWKMSFYLVSVMRSLLVASSCVVVV